MHNSRTCQNEEHIVRGKCISSAQWAPLSDTFTFKFSSYTTSHISHRQFHRVMIRQWMKCSQQLYDSSWKSHLRPLVHSQNINSFNLDHCFTYRQQIFSLSLKRPMIEVSLSQSRGKRRCTSTLLIQTTWITMCWKVIKGFSSSIYARNVLATTTWTGALLLSSYKQHVIGLVRPLQLLTVLWPALINFWWILLCDSESVCWIYFFEAIALLLH